MNSYAIIGFIIVVLIIVIIVISLPGSAKPPESICPPGQQKVCGGLCINPCPVNKPNFNCDKKQCDCADGEEACEAGECCKKGMCNSGICCPETSVYFDGKTAKCCGGGSVASKDKKSCVIPCGPDGSSNVCNSTDACVVLDGLTSDNIAKLKSTPGFTGVISGNNAYFCKGTSACTFGNEQTVPSIVPDNFYPCYNIDKYNKDTGIKYCGAQTLNDPNTMKQCAVNTDPASCAKNSKCAWRDLMQDVGTDYTYGEKNVIGSLSAILSDQTPYGYYCAPDKRNYSRFVAYGKKDGVCSWQDCYTKIAQPGITNVFWDSNNGICTALMSCNSDQGIENKIKCNGPANPVAACKKAGDEVDNPNIVPYKDDFVQCKSNPMSSCPTNLKKPYNCQPSGMISYQSCDYVNGNNGVKILSINNGYISKVNSYGTMAATTNHADVFYIPDNVLQYSKAYPIKNGNGYFTFACSCISGDEYCGRQLKQEGQSTALNFIFINAKDPYNTSVRPMCKGDVIYMKPVSGTTPTQNCKYGGDSSWYKDKKYYMTYVPHGNPWDPDTNSESLVFFQLVTEGQPLGTFTIENA